MYICTPPPSLVPSSTFIVRIVIVIPSFDRWPDRLIYIYVDREYLGHGALAGEGRELDPGILLH